MKLKFYKDDDFVNYRKGGLFLGAPTCSWKCCKELGISCSICQNYEWSKNPILDVDNQWLIQRYLDDPLEECIIFGGLEPMDNFEEILQFIIEFREKTQDEIIIYTGYYPEEIEEKINKLKQFTNIIVKFGRYIPDRPSRYDEVLGVTLISDNQFAKRIS